MIQGVAAVTNRADLPIPGYSGRIQSQSVADHIQGYSQCLHIHGNIVQKNFIAIGAISQTAASHRVGGVKGISGPANGAALPYI